MNIGMSLVTSHIGLGNQTDLCCDFDISYNKDKTKAHQSGPPDLAPHIGGSQGDGFLGHSCGQTMHAETLGMYADL